MHLNADHPCRRDGGQPTAMVQKQRARLPAVSLLCAMFAALVARARRSARVRNRTRAARRAIVVHTLRVQR